MRVLVAVAAVVVYLSAISATFEKAFWDAAYWAAVAVIGVGAIVWLLIATVMLYGGVLFVAVSAVSVLFRRLIPNRRRTSR